ncbi:MAG: hypothetical protein AB2L22_08135 [Syntrophales bacterium]
MNYRVIQLSRRELYEQVWAEPVTQLAQRYGFSDVWLAKICRKNNIPRPPRGYWARKRAGEEVSKIPLPKAKEGSLIEIYARPPVAANERVVRKNATFKKLAIPEIVVSDNVQDIHPSIEISANILASCMVANTGILIPPIGSGCLDIRVSRDTLSRALRIMDALMKAFAAMGFEVTVAQDSTQVRVFDVSLSIALGEELQKVHLKARDHDLDGYYKFGYNLYEENPVPSGRLFLAIGDEGVFSPSDCRRMWRDTESHRLEDLLNSFISGLMKAANVKKATNGASHEP